MLRDGALGHTPVNAHARDRGDDGGRVARASRARRRGVAASAATGVRIGDHPAYVRVVVDFNGKASALAKSRLGRFAPRTASVRVTHPGVTTQTSGGTGHGVRVALQPGTQMLHVTMSFARHRFKYLSYAVVTGNRLAIDLWKSAPPAGRNHRGRALPGSRCARPSRYAGRRHRHAGPRTASSRTSSRSSFAARTARSSAGKTVVTARARGARRSVQGDAQPGRDARSRRALGEGRRARVPRPDARDASG